MPPCRAPAQTSRNTLREALPSDGPRRAKPAPELALGTVLLLVIGCSDTASERLGPEFQFGSQSIAATSTFEPGGRRPDPYAAGELVVRYRGQATRPRRIRVDRGQDVMALVRRYENDPSVVYAHPNYLLELTAVPNDPRYAEQWAHQRIGSESGWDRSTGSSETVIAVIDTGVDWNHPDLAANIWVNQDEIEGNGIDDDANGFVDDVRGWDFVDVTQASSFDPNEDIGPADNDPMDFLGHGTAVAGIAAGASNNQVGLAGVCWRCRIMALRVGVTQRETENLIHGRAYILVSWVADAVRYAADNGADVINLSMIDNNWPGALREAIDYALARDVVVVASAGNYGASFEIYPAAYNQVLAVAATDRSDQRAIWGTPQPPLYTGNASGYGSWVDLAAPGTGILSTDFDDRYRLNSGSSLSTAFASGLAGLVRSLRPSFSRQQVVKALTSTTDRVTSDQYIGTGRINVDAALALSQIPLAEIASPADDQVIGSTGVDISGSAGGANFASYTLRYGRGFYPSSWTTIGTATSAVANGTLATWDLRSLQDNAVYTLQLRVTDTAGNTALSERIVYLQKSVQRGWPVDVTDWIFGDGIVVGNVHPSDDELEIAFTARRIVGGAAYYAGDLHLLNHDGSALPNWPKLGLNSELGPPTLADVTGDGALEVIAGGYDSAYPNATLTFHALSHTGADLPGWPRQVTRAGGYRSHAPSVADLDGDGTVEIVFTSEMTPASGPARSAHIDIHNHDGSPLTGWPKTIALGFPENTSSAAPPASHAALGDLDRDGDLEIVVGLNMYGAAQLQVYHHDGSVMNGWPVTFTDGFTPQPVLADVDADGHLEIVATRGSGEVGIWRRDGAALAGWPQSFSWGGASEPAIADLDNDGDLELVVNYSRDEVVAHHHDGSQVSGWPAASVPNLIGGAGWPMSVVVDVTGDSFPEVIQGSGDEALIHGFNAAGQDVSTWPKAVPHLVTVAPAAADLDRDGTLDLVVAADNSVVVISLGVAPNALHWPMSWHDPQHTGRYSSPSGLIGDLDLDGSITVVDLQLLVNVLLGTETRPAIVDRADLDRGGEADTSDLQQLINIILAG
jgi:subtilisin family serine protease